MKKKGHSIDVVILQATSLKEGGEEMSHNTPWYSKWKLESKKNGS